MAQTSTIGPVEHHILDRLRGLSTPMKWGLGAFLSGVVVIGLLLFSSRDVSLSDIVLMAMLGGINLGLVVYVSFLVHANSSRSRARRIAQWRAYSVSAFGAHNAELVESVHAAVRRINSSAAARAGLLGDVDFAPDIDGITDKFHKSQELSKVVDRLYALANPSVDDRKILLEAKAAIAKLQDDALLRVDLIGKCSHEAWLIDKSLHDDLVEVKTAGQRAELNAKLAAMLYGIEAAPGTAPAETAADVMMIRVQAYREIKNQIQLARD